MAGEVLIRAISVMLIFLLVASHPALSLTKEEIKKINKAEGDPIGKAIKVGSYGKSGRDLVKNSIELLKDSKEEELLQEISKKKSTL